MAHGDGAGGEVRFAHRVEGTWRTQEIPEFFGRRFQSLQPALGGGVWTDMLGHDKMDYAIARVSDAGVTLLPLGASQPPVSYATFSETSEALLLRGYSGIYWRPHDGGETTWRKFEELPGMGFSQAATGPGELTTIFQGPQPGFAVLRGGRWQLSYGEYNRVDYSAGPAHALPGQSRGDSHPAHPGSAELDFLPLPADVFVQRVIDAPDGSLWIGTSDGVLRYQAETHSARRIGVARPARVVSRCGPAGEFRRDAALRAGDAAQSVSL